MNVVRRARALIRLRRIKMRYRFIPWTGWLITIGAAVLAVAGFRFLVGAPAPRSSADFAAWVQGLGTIVAVVGSGILMHLHAQYQRAVDHAARTNAANIIVHAGGEAVLQLDRAYRKAAINRKHAEADATYLADFPAGWRDGWLSQHHAGLLEALEELRLDEFEIWNIPDIVMVVRVRLAWLNENICPALAADERLSPEMESKLGIAAFDVMMALSRMEAQQRDSHDLIERGTFFTLDPATPPESLGDAEKRRWRQLF